MAASVSKWTTRGTDVNAGAQSDGNLNPGDSWLSGSGTIELKTTIRNECHIWIDGTTEFHTEPFTWYVNGDFTVFLNAGKDGISDDAGNVDVDVQGSVDGVYYSKLADLVTWDAGGALEGDETVGHGVYDYDANGVLPYMRLALSPGSDANSLNIGLKVVVQPH